jgi:hypothetical protein
LNNSQQTPKFRTGTSGGRTIQHDTPEVKKKFKVIAIEDADAGYGVNGSER